MNDNNNDGSVNDSEDIIDNNTGENIEKENETEEIAIVEEDKSKDINENDDKEYLDSVKKS